MGSTPPPPRLLDTSGKLFSSPASQIRSLSQLLEDDRRTPLATAFSSRPRSRAGVAGAAGGAAALAAAAVPPPATVFRSPAEPTPQPPQSAHHHVAQGLLAAKETEASMLRQQLQQLTADFKFNLKLLEERDAELERVDAVLAGLREAAGSREAALAEARRTLSAKEATLRDKEARVSALEERQKQLVDLCERQVADARATRDEEVGRARQEVAAAQGDAARQKADVIAGYEQQVAVAAASEREARQRASAAAEEMEHVRSQLSRAEARVAEQELAMQRMVSQFEGALATLQQLEGQYDGLAEDAGAADRLRAARIAELEQEVGALRGARAALQQECDALQGGLATAQAGAADAKQQYHRAMMDASELTEALSGLRAEAAASASRAAAAEEELAGVRQVAQQTAAALEREVGLHAGTQGMLEAMRLHQGAARRDAGEQEALAAQLREAAAVLETERNDWAKAAETAEAKLQAAEERAALLAEQVEAEGQLRGQLLEAREAELAARWERALEAAQGERATLQQALDLANRQLAAAHRDMETLCLQFQHLQLGGAGHRPGPAGAAGLAEAAAAPPAAAARHGPGPSDGGDAFGYQPYAGSSRSSVGRAARAGLGDGSAAGDFEGSVQETASPAGSRDVFSEGPHDHFQHASAAPRQQQQQQYSGGTAGIGPPARSAYQQQLYRHIDTLAGKLSTFQRAVDDARQAGQQASRQLEESSSMLPASLQRRQAAVAGEADQQLHQALAAERQQFEEERRRMDRQLAEQQAALADREAELQRLQRAEEGRQRQQDQDEERRRQREQGEERRRQQEQDEERRRWQQQQGLEQAQQQQQQWQHQVQPEQPWQHRYESQREPVAAAAGHSGEWQPAGLRASWSSPPLPPSRHQQQQQQGQQQQHAAQLADLAGQPRGKPRPLGGSGTNFDLPVLRLPPSGSGAASAGSPAGPQLHYPPPERRSVSAALAAVSGSPGFPAAAAAAAPAAPYAGPAAAQQLPLPQRMNGSLAQAGPPAAYAGSGTAPLRAAAGGLGAVPPQQNFQQTQVQLEGPSGEDPLARARRQVLAAKSYLRQVAEMGGRMSHDGGA